MLRFHERQVATKMILPTLARSVELAMNNYLSICTRGSGYP